MVSGRFVALRAFGAALVGAVACNAVLGIDEANPTCPPDDYCCIVMQNCSGPHAEYLNVDNCRKFDGVFDDTLNQCRLDAAKAAASNPDLECQQAGPLSDCPGAKPAVCSHFCAAYAAICQSTLAYDDGSSNCTTDCQAYTYLAPTPGKGDLSGQVYDSTDTLNCRMYHIENAASLGTSNHCPHSWPNGGATGDPCGLENADAGGKKPDAGAKSRASEAGP